MGKYDTQITWLWTRLTAAQGDLQLLNSGYRHQLGGQDITDRCKTRTLSDVSNIEQLLAVLLVDSGQLR